MFRMRFERSLTETERVNESHSVRLRLHVPQLGAISTGSVHFDYNNVQKRVLFDETCDLFR